MLYRLKPFKLLFLFLSALLAGCVTFYALYMNAQARTGNQESESVTSVGIRDGQDSPSGEDLKLVTKPNKTVFPVDERQAARKALIKEVCKRLGDDAMEMPDLRNIAVHSYHKILYCVTPKCASRQLRTLLVTGFSYGPGEITLARFPDDQREILLNSFFKFTFVREPFERLLSAYKDKFVYPRSFDQRLLQLHAEPILRNLRPFESVFKRQFDSMHKITFREFIQYLVTQGSNKTTQVMDRHWDNYANICGMCAIDFDFIGHYETLEEDVNTLKKLAGQRFQPSRAFDFGKFKASNTSDELLTYYSQIPLEWIQTLGEIFKTSFEMFNYSFPGPLKSLFEKQPPPRQNNL